MGPNRNHAWTTKPRVWGHLSRAWVQTCFWGLWWPAVYVTSLKGVKGAGGPTVCFIALPVTQVCELSSARSHRAANCPDCQQFYVHSQNRQKKINIEEGKVSRTTEWVLSFLKATTKEINILSFCVSCCHPPPSFPSCCPDSWALIPHLFQEVSEEGWCQSYDEKEWLISHLMSIWAALKSTLGFQGETQAAGWKYRR